MKYLNIKLLRDITKNFTQFFSIFFMAVLTVSISIGLEGVYTGLNTHIENFINNSNLPNAFIYATNFTDNDINNILKIKNIDKLGKKTILTSKTTDEKFLNIETFDNSIQNPYIVDGKNLDKNLIGIWINKEFADSNKLSVNDKIQINFKNKTFSLDILGIIQSCDKMFYTGSVDLQYPNYKKYGYSLINEKTLTKYFTNFIFYNQIELKGEFNDIRTEVEDLLKDKFIGFLDRTTAIEISRPINQGQSIQTIGIFISILFMLLSFLSMYTTIIRLIDSQIKEISLFKAIGISNFKILLHYESFAVFIGILSSIFGYYFSQMLSKIILKSQENFIKVPNLSVTHSNKILIIFISINLICILASFIATKKYLKGLPVEFLRGDNKTYKHILIEKFKPFWNKLSFEQHWILRDAFSHKIRLILTISSIIFSLILLTIAFGSPLTLSNLIKRTYEHDLKYKNKYEIQDLDVNKLKDLKNIQLISVNQAHFYNDDGHNRIITIFDNEKSNFFNIKTLDNNSIKDDGIYLTNGFIKRTNYNIGDKIKVKISGYTDVYEFTIKGILNIDINQGGFITKKAFEEKGGKFKANYVLSNDEIEIFNDKNDFINITLNEQKETLTVFLNSLMTIFILIAVISTVLVVVVLYNLGTLSFIERYRDYATLKVIGFNDKKLKIINFIETLIIIILSLPIGIYFAKIGYIKYIELMSTIALEHTPYLNIDLFIYSSSIIIFVTFLTLYIVNMKIKKINMTEALKSVE